MYGSSDHHWGGRRNTQGALLVFVVFYCLRYSILIAVFSVHFGMPEIFHIFSFMVISRTWDEKTGLPILTRTCCFCFGTQKVSKRRGGTGQWEISTRSNAGRPVSKPPPSKPAWSSVSSVLTTKLWFRLCYTCPQSSTPIRSLSVTETCVTTRCVCTEGPDRFLHRSSSEVSTFTSVTAFREQGDRRPPACRPEGYLV